MNIDILMPVYNEEKYIKDAILSVLSYDYDSNIFVHLIVVDDYSTDRTLDIINEIKCANSNCKLTVEKNRVKGKNNAINLAYAISSGDCVCLMGGDDILLPAVLSERASALKLSRTDSDKLGQECAASFCKLRMFSDNPKYNNIIIPKAEGRGSPSGGAIMLTRSYADKIFPLPGNLPNEDTWIWLHLKYIPCEIAHVGKVGLNYRIHEGNSHRRDDNFQQYKNMIWVRSRAYLQFYNLCGSQLPPVAEKQLLREIVVEIAKYLGWWHIVLLTRRIPFKDRIRIFTHSTRLGFWLRNIMFRHFSGR
ncbi:glycosyltransferase family 2 protein [Rhodanobacter panaciterrae]|uniref:glycosyltransferase family 2 protein n=1 Tax=Rhodanobacter panaciterrae TaxID=490572 RepID=UPI0016773633|nr:glycosyltransferase family 2 protein [Rhodanobacter panaciterrae]